LIANSFMQQPQGYALENGHAVLTDFGAVIFNPNVWFQFPHVLFSGLTTGAFFVIGISAYQLLRNKLDTAMFTKSFQIASIVGIIAIFMTILVGHAQAQHMVQTQPMKMAAAESLWESADPASFSLFTIGDQQNKRDVFSLRIPGVLSLLAYNQFSGKVMGINELQALYEQKYGPGNYVPSVFLNYWSFRVMVGAGFLLLLIAAYALFQVMRNKPLAHPKIIALLPFAIFLPYISNSAGWVMTEVGRQPWVVFGLLKTQDAVSTVVSPGLVLASLILFTLVYGALMVADVYLMAKFARRCPAIETPSKNSISIDDEAIFH